ncbi:efflux RND transporter periplasmic adaptor subunit [Candidatus Amarolinea dominans]|uniref:efflux RND transporter periplasmic adaptor subunit n=1 Tax=Candidatus Amarolinea dominans TaxID=3140696 RepID=UPI0031362744|nr:efflux RND transporter periplasmic adaptor subunit [Anaerolineae bacterium]
MDLKLSENDVVEVQLGQAVAVTIDSLAGWQGDGRVAYIAPAGQSSNGVVTYAVRVDFSNADARVKVGMTANVSIITERQQGGRAGALHGPATAGAGRFQAPSADGKTVTEIDVRTGLSDGAYREIVSGLAEGTQLVALPVKARVAHALAACSVGKAQTRSHRKRVCERNPSAKKRVYEEANDDTDDCCA